MLAVRVAVRTAVLLCGSLPLLVPLVAGVPARALEAPKVVVTYSLDRQDDGLFVENVTGTPLGLGDQRFVMDTADDESDGADVLTDSPQVVTIEYTADPATGAIVDGPVELVDIEFEHEFQVDAIGGVARTESDLSVRLGREAVGVLAGSTITWDNDVPFQLATTGQTICTPVLLPEGETVCDLAAPPGGWPRVEDGAPEDKPLPLFTVSADAVFGDRFASDNGTPADELDDILQNQDSQATTIVTWHGAEIDRVVVPEPTGGALAAAALAGLAALSRRRRA